MIILYSHMSYVDGKKILASEIEEELISLATMYMDMELKVYLKKREEIIQTSGPDALTEHERRIPDRILHWLYTILSGHTNRVDALLSLQTVYAKNAKAILDPIFRKVLSEMSPGPLTDISYVRYVLACKLWRERVLYEEDESSKALHQRIVSNLVPVNSYDTFNESLRNCLNKTPRNETNVAKYHLLPHTVNLRLSCELFLKCSQLPTEEINFARISLVDDELEDDEDCQINKLMRMISERKTKFVGFIDLTGDDEPERLPSPEPDLDQEIRDESINTPVFTTIEPMDETATVQTLSSSPAGDEPLEITAMVETPTVVTTIVEQQMVQTTVLTQTTMVPTVVTSTSIVPTSTVVTLAAPTSIVPTLAALTQAVAMHALPTSIVSTSSEIPTSIVSTSAVPTSIVSTSIVPTLETPTSINTTSETPTSINTTSELPTLLNTTLEASTLIKTTSEVSTSVKTTLEAPPPTSLEVPTSILTTLKVPTSIVTTLKVPAETLAAAAAATTTTAAAPSTPTLQSTLTSENLRITEENVYISPQLLNLFIMCASPEEQRRLNQSIQISQSGHLNLDLRNGSIKEAIDNFRKQQQLKKDTHVKNETLIKSDLDAQIELLLDLRTKGFASTEPPPPPESIPPSTSETTPVSRELFPNNSEPPPVVPPECNSEEINKFCDDLFASDLTVVSDKYKQNTSDRTLVTEDSAAFVPQKQLSNVEMTSNRLRSSPIRTTKRSTYSRQLSDKRKSRLRPYHGARSELDRRHRNLPGIERRHRNLPHTITSRSTHDVETDQESPVDLRSTQPEVTQTEPDPTQKDTLRCKPLVELTQSVPAMPAGCSVPDKSPQPEIDRTDQNIPVSDRINEEILVQELNDTILDESNLNVTILDESTILEGSNSTLEAHVEVLGEEEHLPEAIGPEEGEEIDENPTEGMSNEDLISEMVNNDEIYTPKAILCTKPLIDVTTKIEDEINSLKTLINNNENSLEEVINLKTSVSSDTDINSSIPVIEIEATSVQTEDIHDKQMKESVLVDSSVAVPIIDEELTQNQEEVEKHIKIDTGELFIENTCHIEQIPVVENVVSVYESVKISEAPKVAKVEEIAAVEEVALIEQTAEVQQVVTVKEVPVVHEVASVHHVALLEAVATTKQVATVTNLATVTETITITPEISSILEDDQPAPLVINPSEKFKKPPPRRRRRKSFLSPKTKRKSGPKQELMKQTIVDAMLEAQNKLIQITKPPLTINNPVEKPARKVKQRVIVTEETIEPEEKTPRRGRTRKQPLDVGVEPTKSEEPVEIPVQSSVAPEEVLLEVPEVVLLPEVDKLKTKRGRKRKEPLVESVQDESLLETRPKRQKPTEEEPVAVELVDTNQNSTSRRKKAPPCHISTVKLPLEVLSTVSQEQLNPSVQESVENPAQIVLESKRRGRKQNLSTIVLDESLIPPELLQISSCSNIEQDKQLKIMLNKYSDTDLMSLGQKTTRRDRPGPLSSKKSAPAVEEVVVDTSKVVEIEEELGEVVKNKGKDVKSKKKGPKSKDIPAKLPEIVPVKDVVVNDLQISQENINTQDVTTDEVVPVKSTKSRKKSARGPSQKVAEIPEISAESKDTKSRRKSITPKLQEIELKDEDIHQKLTAKAQSLQDISLEEEVVLPNKNQKTRKKAKSLQDISIDSGKSKKKGKLKPENEAEIKIVEDLKPQKELKKPLDEPVKNESTFLIDEALYDAILMEEAKTIKKEQAKKKAEKLEQIKTQESIPISEEQSPDTKVEKELVKDIKSLKKAAILELQKGVPDTPKIQDIKSRRKSAILEHKTVEIPPVTVAESIQPVKDIKSRKKAAILEQAAVVPMEEANPLAIASPETKIEPIKDIKSLKKAAIMEQAKILEKATIPNEEIIQNVISTEETTNTEDIPKENTIMEVEQINKPVGKNTPENVPIMEELKTNEVPLEETKSKKKITKTKVQPVEELQPVIKSRRKTKILPEEIKETPAQTRNSTKKEPKPLQIDEESKEIKPRKRIQKKKLEELETTLEDEEIPLVELIQKPPVLPKKRGRPRKLKQKLAKPETKATKVDDKLKLKVLLPEEIMQRYCPENPSGSDSNNTSFNNATNQDTKLNKQSTKTSDKPQNTRQEKTYKSKTTKLKSFDTTDDLIFVSVTPNEDFVSILKEEKFDITDLNVSEPSEHSISITLPAEEIPESLNNTTSDKQLEEGTLIQEVITENVEIQSEQIKPEETHVKLSEKVEQPLEIVAPEMIPEQSIQPVVNLEETQPDITFSEDTSVESTTQLSILEEPQEIVEPPKKHGKKLKTTKKVGKPIEKSKKSTKPIEPPSDSTEIQLITTTVIQETTEKSSNLTEIAVETVETLKKSTESVEDSQPVVLSVGVDQNQLETVAVDEEVNEMTLEKSKKSIKTTEKSQPLELPIDPKEEELKIAPSIEETIEESQPIESSELPLDSKEIQLETTAIDEDTTEKPLNLKEIDGKIVETSEKSTEKLQSEENSFDFKENQLETTPTIEETTEELPNFDETALKLVEKSRRSTKTTEKLQPDEPLLITKENTLETEGTTEETTEKILNLEEITVKPLEKLKKSKKSTYIKEVQLETAPAIEETIEKPLNSEEITVKPLEKSKKSTKLVENKQPVVSSLVIEPNQLETAAISVETTENLQPIEPSLDSTEKQLESAVIPEEITKIPEPFESSSNFEQNIVETAEKSQNFVENIKKPLEKPKKKRKTSSNEQKPVETPAETLEQQIKTTEESSTEIKIHPEPFVPEEIQEPLLISQVKMENKLKISETTPILVDTSEVFEKTQEKPKISRKRTKSTKKLIESIPEKDFPEEMVTQNSDQVEVTSKATEIVVEISDLNLNQKSLDTALDKLKNEIKSSEESQNLLESPIETEKSLESVMEPQKTTELPIESSRTEDTLEIIIETVGTSDNKSKVTENFEKSFELPTDLSSSEEPSKELPTESSETEILLAVVVKNNEEPVTVSQPEKKPKKKSKPVEKLQKSTELPIETTITMETTENTEKFIELPTISEDIQKIVPLPERITRRKSKLIEKPSTEPCTFIELPKIDVQPLEQPIIVVKSKEETSSSEKLQDKNLEKQIEIDTAQSIPEIVAQTSETINKTVDSVKIQPDIILPIEKKSKKKLKPSETKQIIDKISPEPQEIVELTKKIDKSFEIPTNIPLGKSENKLKQKGKNLKVKIGNEYVNLQIDTSIVVNAGKSRRELKTLEKCDELPKKELDKFKKKLKASDKQQDLVETTIEIVETKLEVPEIVPESTKLIESSPKIDEIALEKSTTIADETTLKKPSIIVENEKPGKKPSKKVQKPIVSTPKMEEITPETLPIVVETQIPKEETLIKHPIEPLLKVDETTSEKSSIVVEKNKSGKKPSIKSQKLIESSPKIVETTPESSSIVEHTQKLQNTSEISSIVTEKDESEKKSINIPSKIDQTASAAAVLPKPKENTKKSDEPSPKFNKTELKDVKIVEISEKKSCETPEIVINKKSVGKSQEIVESSPKIDVIEAPEVVPAEKSTKKLRTSQKTQDIPTKSEEITTELVDQLEDQTKSRDSKKSKGKNLKIKVGNDYINLQIDTSTFKTNNIDAKPKRSIMKDSKGCDVSENKLSGDSGTVLEAKKPEGSLENIENSLNPPIINTLTVENPQLTYEKSSILAPIQRKSTDIVSISQILDNKEAKSPEKLKQDTELISMFIQKNKLDSDLIIQEIDDILMKEDDTEPSTSKRKLKMYEKLDVPVKNENLGKQIDRKLKKSRKPKSKLNHFPKYQDQMTPDDDASKNSEDLSLVELSKELAAKPEVSSNTGDNFDFHLKLKSYENNKNKFISSESDSNSDLIIDTSLESTDSEFNCNLKNNTKLYKRYIAKVVPDAVAKTNSYLKTGKISEDKINHGQVGEEINVEGQTLELESTKPDEQCAKESVVKCSVNGMYKITKTPALIKNPVIKYLPSFQDTTKIFTEPRPHCSAKENVQKSNLSTSTRNIVQVFVTPAPKPVPNCANISPDENYGLNLLANYAFDLEHIDNKPETNGPIFVNEECAMDKDDYCMLVAYPDDVPESDNPAEYFTTFDVNSGEESIHKIQQLTPFPRKAADKNRNGGDFYNISLDDMINSNPNYSYFLHKEQPPRESGIHQDPRPHTTFDPIPIVIPNTADLQLVPDDDDFPLNHMYKKPSTHTYNTLQTPKHFPEHLLEPPKKKKINYALETGVAKDFTNDISFLADTQLDSKLDKTKKHKSPIRDASYLLNKYKTVEKSPPVPTSSPNLSKSPPSYIRSTRPQRMVTTTRKRRNSVIDLSTKKSKSDALFNKLLEDQKLIDSTPVFNENKQYENTLPILEPTHVPAPIIPLPVVEHSNPIPWRIENILPTIPTTVTESVDATITKIELTNTIATTPVLTTVAATTPVVAATVTKPKKPMKEYKKLSDVITKLMDRTIDHAEKLLEKIEQPKVDLPKDLEIIEIPDDIPEKIKTPEPIIEVQDLVKINKIPKELEIIPLEDKTPEVELRPDDVDLPEDTKEEEVIETPIKMVDSVEIATEIEVDSVAVEEQVPPPVPQPEELPSLDETKLEVVPEVVVPEIIPETTELVIETPVVEEMITESIQVENNTITESMQVEKTITESVQVEKTVTESMQVEKTVTESIQVDKTVNETIEEVNVVENRSTTAVEVVEEWLNRTDNKPSPEPYVEISTIEECNFFEELSSSSTAGSSIRKPDEKAYSTEYQTPDSGIVFDEDSTQKDKQLSEPDSCYNSDQPQELEKTHQFGTVSFKCSIPLSKLPEILPRLLALRSERKEITLIKNKKRKSENLDELKIKKRKHLPETDSETQPSSDEASVSTPLRTKGSVKEYPDILFRITSPVPSGSCCINSPYPSDISLQEEPTFYVEGGINVWTDFQDQYYESFDSLKEQQGMQFNAEKSTDEQQSLQAGYCVNDSQFTLPMNDGDILSMIIDNNMIIENNMIIDKRMVAVNMHQVQPEMKPHAEQKEETELCLNTLCPDDVQFINMDQISSECQVVIGGEDNSNSVGTFEELIPMPTADLISTPPPLISLNPDKKLEETINLPPTEVMIESPEIIIHPDIITEPTIIPEPPPRPRRISTLEEDKIPSKKPPTPKDLDEIGKKPLTSFSYIRAKNKDTTPNLTKTKDLYAFSNDPISKDSIKPKLVQKSPSSTDFPYKLPAQKIDTTNKTKILSPAALKSYDAGQKTQILSSAALKPYETSPLRSPTANAIQITSPGSSRSDLRPQITSPKPQITIPAAVKPLGIVTASPTTRRTNYVSPGGVRPQMTSPGFKTEMIPSPTAGIQMASPSAVKSDPRPPILSPVSGQSYDRPHLVSAVSPPILSPAAVRATPTYISPAPRFKSSPGPVRPHDTRSQQSVTQRTLIKPEQRHQITPVTSRNDSRQKLYDRASSSTVPIPQRPDTRSRTDFKSRQDLRKSPQRRNIDYEFDQLIASTNNQSKQEKPQQKPPSDRLRPSPYERKPGGPHTEPRYERRFPPDPSPRYNMRLPATTARKYPTAGRADDVRVQPNHHRPRTDPFYNTCYDKRNSSTSSAKVKVEDSAASAKSSKSGDWLDDNSVLSQLIKESYHKKYK